MPRHVFVVERVLESLENLCLCLCCGVLRRAVVCCGMVRGAVVYCTVLQCTEMYWTVLYCGVLVLTPVPAPSACDDAVSHSRPPTLTSHRPTVQYRDPTVVRTSIRPCASTTSTLLYLDSSSARGHGRGHASANMAMARRPAARPRRLGLGQHQSERLHIFQRPALRPTARSRTGPRARASRRPLQRLLQ